MNSREVSFLTLSEIEKELFDKIEAVNIKLSRTWTMQEIEKFHLEKAHLVEVQRKLFNLASSLSELD